MKRLLLSLLLSSSTPCLAAVSSHGINMGSGTVTSVTASAPLLSSGGDTPNISIPKATSIVDGYLSSADWVTFNSKESALTFVSPLGRSVNTISCNVASGSQAGCLSSADWTAFNGKQASGNYITALTGDVTATGPGSVASTVAKIQGTTVSGTTGTTNVVFSGSPTIATPTITTSATVPLIIGGTGTTSTLTLRPTSGVGTTNADMIFQVGNNGATEAMRILNSGNVGIGTASPAVPLEIYGGGSNPNLLFITASANSDTGASQLFFRHTDASTATRASGVIGARGVSGDSDSGQLFFDSVKDGTASIRMLIDENGNVGIGTVTPNFSFEVQAGSGQFAVPAINIAESAHATGNRATMSFGANSGLSQGWILGQDRLGDGTRNLFLFDLNNSREMMYWSSTGNVGIGTITPNTKLEVAGIGRFTGTGAFSIGSDAAQNRIDAGGGSPQLFRTISASNNYSGFRTKQISVGSTYGDTDSPSDGMIIQGSVGLGTTSPGERLHVSGGNILLDNSYYLSAKDNGGTARVVLYGRFSDNAAYFDGGTGGTYLRVNDGASPTIFLNPSGNVGIGTIVQSARLAVNGHLHLMGTTPTVSSGIADCGTSPAIAGNDNVGRVTVGTSTNGGFCSITFATAWTNTPICFAEDETTGILVRATNVSTTSFRITGLVVAADTIVYHCTGYQ